MALVRRRIGLRGLVGPPSGRLSAGRTPGARDMAACCGCCDLMRMDAADAPFADGIAAPRAGIDPGRGRRRCGCMMQPMVRRCRALPRPRPSSRSAPHGAGPRVHGRPFRWHRPVALGRPGADRDRGGARRPGPRSGRVLRLDKSSVSRMLARLTRSTSGARRCWNNASCVRRPPVEAEGPVDCFGSFVWRLAMVRSGRPGMAG